jgi:hypothetical protein
MALFSIGELSNERTEYVFMDRGTGIEAVSSEDTQTGDQSCYSEWVE